MVNLTYKNTICRQTKTMVKKALLAFAVPVLFFASCAQTQKQKEYLATYDYLNSSSLVEKAATLREQRDLAFEKAKFLLKEQTKKELFAFLSLYLANIGLKNQTQIEMLCEYVYMDIEPVFDEIKQENIEVTKDGKMRISLTLNSDIFLKELNKSIQSNFKRERAVWERFQEQSSQELLKKSLKKLIYANKI
ncbi:MAG: hypothetical protein QG567_2386 [Campylobacterota bacterium]|nr:hypothetical protein [Campylobacterota bacterium]